MVESVDTKDLKSFGLWPYEFKSRSEHTFIYNTINYIIFSLLLATHMQRGIVRLYPAEPSVIILVRGIMHCIGFFCFFGKPS